MNFLSWKKYFILTFTVHCLFKDYEALDYIGCYVDATWGRAFPLGTEDSSNTPERCQAWCRNQLYAYNQYTYFGVQYSNECFCGENYARHRKVNDSECNYRCSGNRYQICGASTRNSVYFVCDKGKFGSGCRETCHCKDGDFCRRSGVCLNGECEVGWEGNSCSTDVNECTKGYCNQNCLNTPGSFSCACYNSSYRFEDSSNRKCVDIDECDEGTHNCSQTCHNTEGGFYCTCNNGDVETDSVHCPGAAASNALVGGLVGAAVLIIVVIALVILILYKRSSSKSDTSKSEIKQSTPKSFKDRVIQRVTSQAVYFRRQSTNKDTEDQISIVDGETGVKFSSTPKINTKIKIKNEKKNSQTEEAAIYENFAIQENSTRIRVKDLKALVDRVREMPDLLSKEFKAPWCPFVLLSLTLIGLWFSAPIQFDTYFNPCNPKMTCRKERIKKYQNERMSHAALPREKI